MSSHFDTLNDINHEYNSEFFDDPLQQTSLAITFKIMMGSNPLPLLLHNITRNVNILTYS